MNRLLLVVACVLPLTVALASADTSTRSPRGKIVYSSQWGPNANNTEIYSIQLDGSQRRDLTRNQGWDSNFAWSPTGDRIAFMAYRPSEERLGGLYVMRADGSRQRRLTPPSLNTLSYEARPSWSPDGRRLVFGAYSSGDDACGGVWVVDADGSNLRRLTQDGCNPVWAPRGGLVAFISYVGPWYALDLVGVETGDRRRLTNGPVWSAPSWSPDGQALAYAGYNTLYRVAAGGGSPELLVPDDGHFIGGAAWSPTGTRIAFDYVGDELVVKTVDANGGPAETVSKGGGPVWSQDGRQIASAGQSEIFVANADGTGRRVVRNERPAQIMGGTAWSPDGHTLLYASEITDNDRELFTVGPDGSHRRQLTKNRVDDVQPAWSPDHRRIAFVRQGSGGSRIWVMSANGGDKRGLRVGSYPSWSPDGRSLAYERDGVVYTMSDRGRRVRVLARGTRPVWAPRGRKIALLRGATLFVVDAKSKTVRLVDKLPPCEYVGEGTPDPIPSRPEWSPTAKRLVISGYCEYATWGEIDVWIVSLRRGVVGASGIDVAPETRLAWSPDGKRLAVSVGSLPFPSFGFRTIAVFDDGGETTVTTGVGDDIDVDW